MREFKRPKVGELIAFTEEAATIGVYLGKIKQGLTTVYYAYLDYDQIQPGLNENYFHGTRSIKIIEPGDDLEIITKDMKDKVVNVMEYYSKFLDEDGLVKLDFVEEQLVSAQSHIKCHNLKDIGYKMFSTASDKVKDACISKVLKLSDADYDLWKYIWRGDEKHQENIANMDLLRVFEKAATEGSS